MTAAMEKIELPDLVSDSAKETQYLQGQPAILGGFWSGRATKSMTESTPPLKLNCPHLIGPIHSYRQQEQTQEKNGP